MDLSPSPLLAQIPQYIAWKPDHKVRPNQYVHSFLPFSIIKKFLRKIAQDQVRRILIVPPIWQSQVWYPTFSRMPIEKPLLLPQYPYHLLNQQAQVHPLITNKTIRLAVLAVSDKGYLQQESQRGLASLFQVQGDKVDYQITIPPVHSGLAGVMKEKLIHFDVL